MERQYRQQPEDFRFFNLDEYIDLVIDFLELLKPSIVVERFAGEVPPRFIAGPHWGSLRYNQILNAIEQQLLQRNTWQGHALLNIADESEFLLDVISKCLLLQLIHLNLVLIIL